MPLPLHNENPDHGRRFLEPEEWISSLTLNLADGIGPVLMQRLLQKFGNAEAVLAAEPSQLQEVEGIGSKAAQRIALARTHDEAKKLIDQCRQHEILLISQDDIRYPPHLRRIPNPPAFLYIKGEWKVPDNFAVAVVGTRHATSYGLQQAERLGAELSQRGLTVVSGLAEGIDGAAHRGALSAGGRTLAVLGNGLLHLFPAAHGDLAKQVAAHGALLSEYRPEQTPQRGMFPQRNRIISGLSLGVLVIEAPPRSGALITAELALKQNRPVFAMPGPVQQEESRGCHQLLRSGAVLVESADDIVQYFRMRDPAFIVPAAVTNSIPAANSMIRVSNPSNIPAVSAAKKTESVQKENHEALQLNETEKSVYIWIQPEPTPIDRIINQSGLPAHQVLAVLSMLELRRLIRRTESNTVMRMTQD